GVASATNAGLVPTPPNDATKFFSGAATFVNVPPPPQAAAGSPGLIPSVDIQVFATPGPFTWQKPIIGTPRMVRAIAIGGGGGGSSGEYRASGTAMGGGAGGAGGNFAT